MYNIGLLLQDHIFYFKLPLSHEKSIPDNKRKVIMNMKGFYPDVFKLKLRIPTKLVSDRFKQLIKPVSSKS